MVGKKKLSSKSILFFSHIIRGIENKNKNILFNSCTKYHIEFFFSKKIHRNMISPTDPNSPKFHTLIIKLFLNGLKSLIHMLLLHIDLK